MLGICVLLGASGTMLYLYLTQNETAQSCALSHEQSQEISQEAPLNSSQDHAIKTIKPEPQIQSSAIPQKNPSKQTTYPYNKPFLTGFQSQKQIVKLMDKDLEVVGCIPEWLYGSYVAVGPAQFEAGESKAHHWLDGLAMVHRFAFKKGHVSYANQFIHSYYFNESISKGTLTNSALASDPNASYFAKLRAALSDSDDRPPYDNTNIGIINHNNKWIALTETPNAISIDRNTLKSDNEYVFTDDIKMHTMSAHPIIDPHTHELFDVGTTFGHKSTYTIFKLEPHSFKREVVAQMSTGYPSYLHSFAITDKSIVLTQVPFVLNPYDLLTSSKPFIENFVWKPRQKTALSVFDRKSGELIHTFYIDPTFIFNHVNAFQTDDVITLDVITHKDPSMIAGYKMAQLFSNNHYAPPLGTVTRITLNLKTGVATIKQLTQIGLEWPSIHFDAIGMKPYHYIWALSAQAQNDFYTMIVKYDIKNQSYVSWSEPLCYPTEPTFVPKPGGTQEDDGVIMSVVLNAVTKKSFLLILDAHTMKEIARVLLPVHVPFITHGTWMPRHRRSLPEFIKEEILRK